MKTNITNGMAAERASRCENSTPASANAMARRPQLNSSVRRPARPNRTMDRNRLLNSSVRPTSRRTSGVLGRAEWMKEIGMNCSRMECKNLFGHSKDEMVSGTARWDQTLERAYNDYCNEECNVNSARRPLRRPVLNSSVRHPLDSARIGKTVEVPIIQGNYGYGWEDVSEYEKGQDALAKADIKEYRASKDGGSYRLIYRRVPNPTYKAPETVVEEEVKVDSSRRPAMRHPINRPILNSNRQSLRSVLEKAHAARLNSSLRPMSRRAKLNSSEEDAFDDADFDVTDNAEIIDADVDNTAEAIPAEEVPTNDDGAVDVTELLIVQDPESKELSLFIQDTEDETLPESVEVIAAVDPATEADLDSSCNGKKKLNSSEEDGAENAAEDTDDADAEKADDAETETETEESVEIELADGDTVAVDDIYVVQSEDGELDLFIAEEGAELPESVEVVGEAVAVEESEVLDSSRKMIKRGKTLNAGKKAGCARLNSGANADKSFKELKETYSWSFKKYPDVSSVIGYKNIGFEQTTYTKQGSKWVEGEKESNNVDWEFYLNTIDAAPFFKNMGGKEKLDVKYTKVGKVPFQVTSINPDGTEKIVRTFNFDSAERKAN